MIEPRFYLQAVTEHYGHDRMVVVVRENGPYIRFDSDQGREEPLTKEMLARAEAIAAEAAKPGPKRWTRTLDFKLEFTQAERRAMRDLARRDPIAEDFLDLLNGTNGIVANDPLLLDGLGYMVSKAVVTQQRIDAILGT